MPISIDIRDEQVIRLAKPMSGGFNKIFLKGLLCRKDAAPKKWLGIVINAERRKKRWLRGQKR
jgi:hypothetical protein